MNDVIEAAWIAGALQGGPILVTALVGLKALRSWRQDAIGRRRVQIAEECLAAAWELRLEIKSVRKPYLTSTGAGGPVRSEESDEQREERERLNQLIATGMARVESSWRSFQRAFRIASYYIKDTPRIPFQGSRVMQDAAEHFSNIIGLLNLYRMIAYDSKTSGLSEQSLRNITDYWYKFHGIPECAPPPDWRDEIESEISVAMDILEKRLRRELR